MTKPNLIELSQSAPSNGWNAAQVLEANTGGLQIAVASNADGRLEIFTIGDDFQVYHKWQTAPNAGFSAYTSFSGATARQIALGTNADGRLELVYIGVDHNLYHNWEATPSNGPWNGAALGGQAKQISLTRNVDGRLELFFIGMDDFIYHAWQTAPNSTSWGQAKYNAQAVRIVAAPALDDGRIRMVYASLSANLTQSNLVFAAVQQSAGSTTLSPAIGLSLFAKDLTLLSRSDGSLDLFCIDLDDRILRVPEVGRTWQRPEIFGGQAQQICFGRDADGRFDMFFVGMDGYLYQTWQTSVNGPFVPAARSGSGYRVSYIAVTTSHDGRICAFFQGYTNFPTTLVSAPYGSPPLEAWSNYSFYNDGRPLYDVVVDVHVTQDMVIASANGLSVQVNCSCPTDTTIYWQQYVLEYDGTSLYGWTNNWDAHNSRKIEVQTTNFATASGQKIPAGYHLQIRLYNGYGGNVVGARYTVWDDKGNQLGTQYADNRSSTGFVPDFLAPVLAVQTVIVGTEDGNHSSFSSGSGTITCSASAAMHPLGAPQIGTTDLDVLPSSVGFTLTLESSNITYDVLENVPLMSFPQRFVFAKETLSPKAEPLDPAGVRRHALTSSGRL